MPSDRESSTVYAALSPSGTLAVHMYDKNGFAIYFINLVNGDRTRIPIEDWTSMGFYDDKVVFVTIGKPIRECSLANIWMRFDGLELIDKGGPEDIMCDTDMSLINERRVFYYATTSGDMYRYNVDSGLHEHVPTGVQVSGICPTTGIDTGFEVLFTGEGEGWEDVHLYGININNGEVKKLFSTKADRVFSMVIPSSSQPFDISKAIMLSFNGRFYSGTHPEGVVFQAPLGYNRDMSLVRLYKDVFLMLDSVSHEWFLVRLAVP